MSIARSAIGDRVFGLSTWRLGGHAEYVCVAADGLTAHLPVCDGGLAALTALRAAGVRAGQRVLVYGASESIGTAGSSSPGISVPTSPRSATAPLWRLSPRSVRTR